MGSQALYGGVARRPARAFSPWFVAATAWALGSLTAGFAALGLALLGYAESPPLSPADLVHMVSTRYVPQDALAVFGVTQGLAVLVQAMWLVPRGRHPLLAPVASVVLGWVAAAVVAPFTSSPALLLGLTAAVQILVLVALTGRSRPGAMSRR